MQYCSSMQLWAAQPAHAHCAYNYETAIVESMQSEHELAELNTYAVYAVMQYVHAVVQYTLSMLSSSAAHVVQ